MTGYGKRMAALIAAGFALGGKPQTVGAVHMTHTGARETAGLLQQPRVLGIRLVRGASKQRK